MRIIKSDDTAAFESALQSFNVGTRVQLRAQRDTGTIEHFSSLIGFAKDEFLMVKLPMVRNTPVAFYDGEPIVLRAFTGTTIYSFTTTVIRTLLAPVYYMHLAYPSSIESSALRSELRVKVNMPADLEYVDLTGRKTSAQVKLANISMSGAAIDSKASLKVGQQVQLSFTVNPDGVERVVRAKAIVRSASRAAADRSGKSTFFSSGVQFEHLDSEGQMTLRLLTYETVLSNRQNIV